jgi:hypothetical protein
VAPQLKRRWGFALLLATLGCNEPTSRQAAVTLLDAEEIECVGVTTSEAFEQETMDSIAKDVERQWEDEKQTDPPTPEGRTMRINETEEQMQAWFDPHPSTDLVSDSERYDSPEVVYVGEYHDDYVEGVYEEIFNTDEQDEDAGRELCGDRVRVRGTLSLTDAKGILGRIRWLHIFYIDGVTSACAGRIECVRDIAVDGLELD